MECEEFRVDMDEMTEEDMLQGQKEIELMFKMNNTLPRSEEYMEAMDELFGENMGEGSFIMAPFAGAAFSHLKLGKNVFVNSNSLLMCRGGITVEDNVLMAANVQLISNNHDEYQRQVLTCKPVLIKEGAWIGAGATILPGVCVGKHAIVGASAVVTKDVPDYAVVVGSPAKVIKYLDEDKFE